ncbi:MAG: hypothetical protein JWM02_3499 [Frankiales bacterium]|nr:hypothetical protein [Frankiales bacterium]
MEVWDQDAVDLLAPGFFEFEPDSLGRLGFKATTTAILPVGAAGRGWSRTAPYAVVSTCI